MSDLYYLAARLRAMRAQFLSRRDYERILALPDLPVVWDRRVIAALCGSMGLCLAGASGHPGAGGAPPAPFVH